MAAELIVTGPVPVEVSVSGWVDVEPTVTLPNVMLAALRDNCGLGADVPVPFRETVAVAFVEELLFTVRMPVSVPVPVGANRTCSVIACCGFNVTGRVAPWTVNPVPLIESELIVTGAVPEEVNVTGWIDEEPTLTSPKLRLVALTVSCGVAIVTPLP
jgi:hypothetical protein